MNHTEYDEDYYQRGIETGKSCYQQYRWVPELTLPMAVAMIDTLGIRPGQTVLDFGCALGYLVKAFRLLRRKAFGVDCSEYAIQNADPSVRNLCYFSNGDNKPLIMDMTFDFCVAKDVFEHIEEERLSEEIGRIKAKMMFAVIPLGEDCKYVAPSNGFDKTHVICESKRWWIDQFRYMNWVTRDFSYQIPGIKDSYYEKYPESFGFFILAPL